MGLLRSLVGMVVLEVTTADPEGFLQALQNSAVAVYGLQKTDPLTIRLQISRQDQRYIARLAQKQGATLQIYKREGFYWTLRALKKRPVLVLGLLFLLLFSLWVPGRVFFVRVEGNTAISAAQIIEKAETCGIGFGASRRLVRSEHIKNELLNAMPELGWAGVNTYGCVAVITVRERATPELPEEGKQVSSIVAQRDGIVQSMTVLQGSAQCKPGDAVKAGQVLISGYTDCGIYIQAGKAQGEIFAQTRRLLTAFYPSTYYARGPVQQQQQKISLILGKKRINFAKDSGISRGSCAKIRMVYYMTLPGGFQLPVALEVETLISYQQESSTDPLGADILKAFSADYILQQTVAGAVEYRSEVITEHDGLYRLDGSYICTEMIGLQRIEEKLQDYGKDH